ncbi:hypothetical protein TNCV_4997161 [Trichonephila clavipes]|nr:hypothetical protein TNCV_4997161 [Trichonephila clavipes]
MNPDSVYSIKMVASMFGGIVVNSHWQRAFVSHTGPSPGMMIYGRKISRAASLLQFMSHYQFKIFFLHIEFITGIHQAWPTGVGAPCNCQVHQPLNPPLFREMLLFRGISSKQEHLMCLEIASCMAANRLPYEESITLSVSTHTPLKCSRVLLSDITPTTDDCEKANTRFHLGDGTPNVRIDSPHRKRVETVRLKH